jgi:uncharacterized protein (DUF952 family)
LVGGRVSSCDNLGCKEMKIYKIFTTHQYEALKHAQTFTANPMDIESGFVHLSFEAQLNGIIKKFFGEHDKVFIAEIDCEKLNLSKLREESNSGGQTKYPHYYGDIPKNAFINFVEKDVKQIFSE